MEEASEREKEREERRERGGGIEWNSELTRRREITALSLLRLSSTLHRDCATVVAVKDIDEHEKGRPTKLVVLFSIHQPINSTSHLRSRN